MKLTKKEREIADGKGGAGAQTAMKILEAYGKACEAERMIPITSAHIAGNWPVMLDEGIEWIEDLAQSGAKVSVYTTKNPEMFDFEERESLNVPKVYQERQERIDAAIRKLGVIPTYSCHHYLVGNVPRFGDHIAWASSGSQVFANSVIGARSNRDGDHVVLAAAITGVIPEWGLHLTENRKGEVLVDTERLNLSEFTTADYQALGWYVGKMVGDRIPVFPHLPPDLAIQDIKGILYSMTVTGAMGLAHLVGITPEAPTLEDALGSGRSSASITVESKHVEKAYSEISSRSEGKVDLVIFGCPQCSIQEVQEIADLLNGKKVHPDTELWICTSQWVKTLSKRMELLERIKAAGGRIVADIGAADGPHIYLRERGVRVIAINSARGSYYSHNIFGMDTRFGSTEVCVEAAISGNWRGHR